MPARAGQTIVHLDRASRPSGFVHSVVGRLSWWWLLRSAAVLAPLLLIYLSVSVLLDPSQSVQPAEWVVLLVVVLVLASFQAAAEEYRSAAGYPAAEGMGGQLGVLPGSADPWPSSTFGTNGRKSAKHRQQLELLVALTSWHGGVDQQGVRLLAIQEDSAVELQEADVGMVISLISFGVMPTWC